MVPARASSGTSASVTVPPKAPSASSLCWAASSPSEHASPDDATRVHRRSRTLRSPPYCTADTPCPAQQSAATLPSLRSAFPSVPGGVLQSLRPRSSGHLMGCTDPHVPVRLIGDRHDHDVLVRQAPAAHRATRHRRVARWREQRQQPRPAALNRISRLKHCVSYRKAADHFAYPAGRKRRDLGGKLRSIHPFQPCGTRTFSSRERSSRFRSAVTRTSGRPARDGHSFSHLVRPTLALSCEAVPASDMGRRGHEPALLPRNGAGESFVSFIALFGGPVAPIQGYRRASSRHGRRRRRARYVTVGPNQVRDAIVAPQQDAYVAARRALVGVAHHREPFENLRASVDGLDDLERVRRAIASDVSRGS